MDPRTVPATLDALEKIRDYVRAAALAAGLEKKASYNLQMAVDEIATNVVTYGYADAGRTGDVTVHAELSPTDLSITLEDSGVPFDPRSADVPEEEDLSRPLETRPVGGLGIFLALNTVDEFRYERQNQRNRNIFVMRRPSVVRQ